MLPQISCVWQGEGWCRMNIKDHQITKETPTFTLMNQLYSSRNREANLQVCQSLTFGYSISQTSPILLTLLHNQCIFPTSSRLLLPHPSNPCWMLLKHECSCLTCWKLRMYAGLLEATIIMYAGSYGYAYESLFLPAWSLLYCSCALRLFRLLPLLTVASAAMHPRKQLGGVRWKCRLLSGCEHGCLSLFMSMLFWLNVNSRILGALRQVKALPGSKIKPCTSHPVKKCSPATLHACPAVKLAPVPGLPEGGARFSCLIDAEHFWQVMQKTVSKVHEGNHTTWEDRNCWGSMLQLRNAAQFYKMLRYVSVSNPTSWKSWSLSWPWTDLPLTSSICQVLLSLVIPQDMSCWKFSLAAPPAARAPTAAFAPHPRVDSRWNDTNDIVGTCRKMMKHVETRGNMWKNMTPWHCVTHVTLMHVKRKWNAKQCKWNGVNGCEWEVRMRVPSTV
jgi:hypothetical protein